MCCACGGGDRGGGGSSCDTVTVSGSSYQTAKHGTYTKLDFACNDLPYYKCDDCSASEDTHIWYRESQSKWYIGPEGCGASARGIEIEDQDGDLAVWSGKWSEWDWKDSSEWKKNSNIKVKCAGD